MKTPRKTDVTFIDLFCGCGGFSLGLRQAGFRELAAIDLNQEAVTVFRKNFPQLADHILEKDLQEYKPEELSKLIGTKKVDVIVGGPPCQGFSTVRQRDGANSGSRIVHDERRELYQEFLKFVAYFKPKIFVIENVLGIRSAAGGHFFNRVQAEARELGYRVHGEIIKAWEFGVPQKRERQLIIGTHLGLPLFSGRLFMPITHTNDKQNNKQKFVSVGEAISDLPPVRAGEGDENATYDLARRKRYLQKYSARYIFDVLEANQTSTLTAHRARPHNARDLRDFNKLIEGETSAHAIKRGVEMEFPYDRKTFKDRYTKQSRDELCSTIVAHLSKDGLMFIHPTQNRSLTPREAARIQSFPDWFTFPVAKTHQYRLIGNAVPPLVGKAVGLGILQWFSKIKEYATKNRKGPIVDKREAAKWIIKLSSIGGNGKLSQLPIEQFKQGWTAIAYFFNHLHPDSAAENGSVEINGTSISTPTLFKENPQLVQPIYERSGWPVALAPIALEAFRRFEKGDMTARDYYCSEFFIAGYLNMNGRKV